MELMKVHTNQSKAKVSLQGASGSGKTYSALLLAYTLAGAWGKVAIIETNYASAHHYSYLGRFQTLTLSAPFSPQKFMDALALCEKSAIGAVIIDNLSAEWAGTGGMLDKLKEEGDEAQLLHEELLTAIQKSNCHIICTLQTEECYNLSVYNSERKVEKHGLKPFQNEDIHYHFHTCLYLDMQHRVSSFKDRSSFFEEHQGIVITDEIASLFASRYEENNIVTLKNLTNESLKTSA
jgi:hypothetical protein